jgi:hypothetical protein
VGSGAQGGSAGGSATDPGNAGAAAGGQSGTAKSGAGGGGSQSGGSSRPRSSDRASTSDRTRDETRSDRALRHAVLAREACLGRMPRSERRVLTLRAGVGRARPRTRSQVERITGLRRARVVALERSGLRRLRSLSATGCANGAGSATDPISATAMQAPPSPPTGGQPQITVRGQRQSSEDLAADEHVHARPRGSGLPLLHTPNSPLDLVPFAIAFGLAAGVFVFVREARRSD